MGRRSKLKPWETLLIPYRMELVGSNKSAIMTKVVVYEEDTLRDNKAIVGYGYVITCANGMTLKPILYNLKGEELQEGLFRLMLTDESQLVTVPRMVQ